MPEVAAQPCSPSNNVHPSPAIPMTARLDPEAPSLSPPHSWPEEDHLVDDRLLFTVVVALPKGTVVSSRTASSLVEAQSVAPGCSFLDLVEHSGQSFFLSASINASRQRLYARVKCGASLRPCELDCEFNSSETEKLGRVKVRQLHSAFGPATQFRSVCFTTKHSTTAAITHIDHNSVTYHGRLPTDLIGRSIFSFIYAPDVRIVLQAHIDLHVNKGRVVRSVQPLRLVCHNGSLLTVETEWSAYVNPWNKKIEMVVSRHKVIDVPVGDADVMATPAPGARPNVLPSALARPFEEELRNIMSRPVPSSKDRPHVQLMCPPLINHEAPQQQDQHQQQQLAQQMYLQQQQQFFHQNINNLQQNPDIGSYIERLVESLVAQTPQSAPSPVRVVIPTENNQQKEISLAYNQINCLENVHRLLKSLNKTEREDGTSSPVAHDLSGVAPPLPLTRQTLMEHTRRWEEQCKHTWRRRLCQKRAAASVDDAPAAKHSRPASAPSKHTRTAAPIMHPHMLRYAPNPSPPSGSNYVITSVPLPPSVLPERVSAFSSVPPRSQVNSAASTPLALSIGENPPSVIQQSTSSSLLATRQLTTPPPPQPPTECLLLDEGSL